MQPWLLPLSKLSMVLHCAVIVVRFAVTVVLFKCMLCSKVHNDEMVIHYTFIVIHYTVIVIHYAEMVVCFAATYIYTMKWLYI